MALMLILSLAAAAAAAPPSNPERVYGHPQQEPNQAQLQQLNALDYYLDRDVGPYYNPHQQKQEYIDKSNTAPARLESMEPDSEVETLPGFQPQQPPQQTPVSPNVPGLVPGQRVFIVHMPIPGYRPGTVGGYQPVYVVAAAPNHNNNNQYLPNGYQNTLLLDPATGQVMYSPLVGYNRGLAPGGPQYLVGAPLGYNGYQAPGFGYQQIPGLVPNVGVPDAGGAVRLAQLVNLQHQGQQAASTRSSVKEETEENQRSARITEASESKEDKSARNFRPKTQRNKA